MKLNYLFIGNSCSIKQYLPEPTCTINDNQWENSSYRLQLHILQFSKILKLNVEGQGRSDKILKILLSIQIFMIFILRSAQRAI